MHFKLLRLGLIMVVCGVFLSCAQVAPQKKSPLDEPGIKEEDISQRPPGEPSTLNVPPAPPVEPAPPVVDPGSQPRRRIKW